MKEKTTPFQFRIRSLLKDFLKSKNPKNQSQVVNELIEQEKVKEEAAIERYEILNNAEESLSHIKKCALSGEEIKTAYYEFMIDAIHSFTRVKKSMTDSKEELLTFLNLTDDTYKAIIGVGRKIDSEDFISSKMSLYLKNREYQENQRLSDIIQQLKKEALESWSGPMDFERVLRALSLLITEEGFRYIDADKVFRPYISELIHLTDESVKHDAKRNAEMMAENLEHESKVVKAFADQKENEYPIAYGNNSNPLRASVCTASIYTDENQNLTIVLKETGIGYASITNFVEQIAKSVLDKFIPNEMVENTTWYQIERGFSNHQECDKVGFSHISKGGVSHPTWTKVDIDYFNNEIISQLKPFKQ